MRVVYRVAALTMSALPVLAGDVTVQVVITRQLTKKSVTLSTYNLRGAAPVPSVSDRAPLNEFDRTIVLLSGKKPAPLSPETVTIEQRSSRFEPDLVAIPVGSTIRFPNFDPIFHNVFSLSRTQSFDLGFYPKGQAREVKFERAGIVQVYCHIHANMYAAIVVTDSRWYGKPGSDGSISWADLPPGRYKAAAWHKIAGMFETEVDVPSTGKVQVVIKVPLNAERKQ
jgi:plastocyanin